MPYSTRSDVESIYGKRNVEQWADLDNTADEAVIASRIEEAILDADDLIDSELRPALFALPVVDPAGQTPRLIRRLSAMQAGIVLYEARGSQDVSEETGQPIHRYVARARYVLQSLAKLITGELDIEAVRTAGPAPVIVDDA